MIEQNQAPDETPTLAETKQLVRERYMGKCGIHGVGAKASQNAIRIYVFGETPEFNEAKKQIQKLCEPYRLDVVIEEAPSLLPNPPETPVE